ncbi:MAG: PAS domain-containing protein [Pseudomonadota bacterium]
MTDIPFFRDEIRRTGPNAVDDPSQDSATSVVNPIRNVGSRTQSRPQSDSRDLLRYWNETRQNLDLPRRSDIDPRGIAGMLSRTFILEQIAPGLARFRVAGTQLADLLGMDVRGMPLSAMVLPEARDELAQKLEQVFEMPGILRAALVSPGGFRRPELEAELLILPLRDEHGEVSRAIGCLVANGTIGKAPRRFSFRHIRVDPVSVVKATHAEMAAPASTKEAKPSERPSTGTALRRPRLAPPKPGQPSYLRLVLPD